MNILVADKDNGAKVFYKILSIDYEPSYVRQKLNWSVTKNIEEMYTNLYLFVTNNK